MEPNRNEESEKKLEAAKNCLSDEQFQLLLSAISQSVNVGASTSAANPNLPAQNTVPNPRNRVDTGFDWEGKITEKMVEKVRKMRLTDPGLRETARYNRWLQSARRTGWIAAKESGWEPTNSKNGFKTAKRSQTSRQNRRESASPYPKNPKQVAKTSKSSTTEDKPGKATYPSGSGKGSKAEPKPEKEKSAIQLLDEQLKAERKARNDAHVVAKQGQLTKQAKIYDYVTRPAAPTTTQVACPFCGGSGWTMGFKNENHLLPCANCDGRRLVPRETPWNETVAKYVVKSPFTPRGRPWATCPRCRINFNKQGQAIVWDPREVRCKGDGPHLLPPMEEWVLMEENQLPLKIRKQEVKSIATDTSQPMEVETEQVSIPVKELVKTVARKPTDGTKGDMSSATTPSQSVISSPLVFLGPKVQVEKKVTKPPSLEKQKDPLPKPSETSEKPKKKKATKPKVVETEVKKKDSTPPPSPPPGAPPTSLAK